MDRSNNTTQNEPEAIIKHPENMAAQASPVQMTNSLNMKTDHRPKRCIPDLLQKWSSKKNSSGSGLIRPRDEKNQKKRSINDQNP